MAEFLLRYETSLKLASGRGAGMTLRLNRERTIVGRGPGVDRAFDDPSMSRQHASIEFCGTGFRIRDLGSTNGILVNGSPVQTVELHHGDEVSVGEQRFVVVVEERDAEPEVYEIEA
ncbi:MAG TPA: FHA domain-containing protein [Candidatus Polarisedimenticolaceae bacterium]|nr:FHA domain-containing protein [Candidatus Polarisedimenticolaceae bacterium]